MKRDLQRLREKTLKENKPAWRLRWQPHHQDWVLSANNPHTLNPAIKETDVKRNRTDNMMETFSTKRKTKIGFWNVRTLRESGKLKKKWKRRGRPKRTWKWTIEDEAMEAGKTWSEVKRLAVDRTRWRRFTDALCSRGSNRN
jgi:hypothetical protein